MNEVLWAAGGVVAGAIAGWQVASHYERRRGARRIEEAERRTAEAESDAAARSAVLAETRERLRQAEEEREAIRSRLEEERAARVQAETERTEAGRRLAEERQILDEARTRLSDAFKALAAEALGQSHEAFLHLATQTFEKVLTEARGDWGKRQEAIQGLVHPLAESLRQIDEHMRGLERARQSAYASLEGSLKTLASAQEQLQRETSNLVTALRTPQVRGRWGELSLRRAVELAGLAEHCDFEEQPSVTREEGRLRPDMIVRLPGGGAVVIDAKVALDAFLDSLQAASEEARRAALERHAAQVRAHMNALASKSYWEQFDRAPDFVVMFIPGEPFFGAAASVDARLIEDALARKVVMATPATLIALLRAVAYGWRQEQLAANAKQISELGQQLHERMRVLIEHLVAIGEGLDKANRAYNEAVGSLESRLLPAARRFKDLGVGGAEEIPVLEPLDRAVRTLRAPEGENPVEGDIAGQRP